MAKPRNSKPGRHRPTNTKLPQNYNEDDEDDGDFDMANAVMSPQYLRQLQAERQRLTAEQQAAPPREFQQITGLSEAINKRAQGLFRGIQGVHEFMAKRDENQDYANFYENNQEALQNLLKMGRDLDGTYTKLAKISSQRENIHKELVQKGYLTPEEMNTYLGITSPAPLQAYLKELQNRPTQEAVADGEPPKPPRPPLSSEDLADLSRATHQQFPIIRDRLIDQGKLNEAEVQRLNSLAPPSDVELQRAKDAMGAQIVKHDIAKNTSYHQSLKAISRQEEELVAELDEYTETYNSLVAGLIKQMRELTSKAETAHIRAAQLRQLSRETGLSTLCPGQTLWISSQPGSKETTNLTTRVNIQSITFGEAGADPDRSPEEQLVTPSFDPMIEFTITNSAGESETLKLSPAAFKKWALNNNLSEKFTDTAALEKSLGLPPEALQPGTVLHYQVPRENVSEEELGSVTEHQTTVENVADGHVYLSHPVSVPVSHNGANRLRHQQTKKLSLEQFAKWYRQFNAMPQINDLKALDSLLAEHHEQLKKEMNWPADHGQPIQVSNATFPLFLISAYDPHTKDVLKVTGIQKDPDGGAPQVLIEGREPTPLNDFYRLVRENGGTIPNAEQLEEIKSRPDLMTNPEEQTKKLDEAAANTPKTPTGQDGKTADGKADVEHPKRSYFGNLWDNTRVLNLMQLYELLIKAPSEQIEKYFKERMERSTNFIGKQLHKNNPSWLKLHKVGDKFLDAYNSDVSKQVEDKLKFYENNNTPEEVFKILYKAPDKITLKAALQFLCKQGLVRWEDDKDLHKILNHLINTHTYPKEHHEALGVGRTIKAGDAEVSGKVPRLNSMRQCEMLLDAEFGPGTYENLNGTNEGAYKKARTKANEEYHDYDKLQGKVPTILRKMMDDFSKDIDVSPAIFDGLLSGALTKNEIGLAEGFMLYITSLTLKNSKGQTLLPFSKTLPYVGELSSYNAFLYFVVPHEVLDENGRQMIDDKGQPRRAPFTLREYQRIFETVIKKDIEVASKDGPERFIVGKNLNTWIRAQVLTNKQVKQKIGEKINNANTDPNLYQYIGPGAQSDSNVEQLVRKTMGGGRESTTIIKNTYAGYNEQMKVAANRLGYGRNEDDNDKRAEEFANLVNTFTYFNHILKRRMFLKNGDDTYMRLSSSIRDSKLDIDSNKKRLVNNYIKENEEYTHSIIHDLAEWTGEEEYIKLYRKIIIETGDVSKEEEFKLRNYTFEAIQEMHRDDPALLAKIARKYTNKLQGMTVGVLSEEGLNVDLAPASYG